MTDKTPTSITRRLVEHAWEVLPQYGDAKSMADAQIEGTGTCLHRSIVIGRRATELGLESMRRITFGADMLPHHFSNYVRDNASWLYVSTGRTERGSEVGHHGYEFDETRFYASFGGLALEALEAGGYAHHAMVVVIPERSMSHFRECVLSQQYIRKAYQLTELATTTQGVSSHSPSV